MRRRIERAKKRLEIIDRFGRGLTPEEVEFVAIMIDGGCHEWTAAVVAAIDLIYLRTVRDKRKKQR